MQNRTLAATMPTAAEFTAARDALLGSLRDDDPDAAAACLRVAQWLADCKAAAAWSSEVEIVSRAARSTAAAAEAALRERMA